MSEQLVDWVPLSTESRRLSIPPRTARWAAQHGKVRAIKINARCWLVDRRSFAKHFAGTADAT